MASGLATPGASAAVAQNYPSRPLRIVVPFAAGAGVLDIMARLVGQHLAAALGQQVVIDNRPGAGGIVGAEVVARAARRLHAADGQHRADGEPVSLCQASFDPLTDFVPVTR